MHEVKLEPTGLWVYKWSKKKDGYVRKRPKKDVIWTYLRDSCEITEGTTLRNIFDTVEKYDMLMFAMSQYSWCGHIAEFHEQARLPYVEDENDLKEPLTGLEIAWIVSISGGAININTDFVGLGPIPKDYKFPLSERQKESNQISYSVSYTPMHKLAHLPVRLNEQVYIYREQSRHNRDKIIWQGTKHFTLLDVLDAIYDDISFMGGPDDNATFLDEMSATVKEITDGREAGKSDEELGLKPIEELFPELEDDKTIFQGDPELN